jgi:hypothetical protein
MHSWLSFEYAHVVNHRRVMVLRGAESLNVSEFHTRCIELIDVVRRGILPVYCRGAARHPANTVQTKKRNFVSF